MQATKENVDVTLQLEDEQLVLTFEKEGTVDELEIEVGDGRQEINSLIGVWMEEEGM